MNIENEIGEIRDELKELEKTKQQVLILKEGMEKLLGVMESLPKLGGWGHRSIGDRAKSEKFSRIVSDFRELLRK